MTGLVKAGVLLNDGWTHVAGWDDSWEVNKATEPGVFITIEPVSHPTRL